MMLQRIAAILIVTISMYVASIPIISDTSSAETSSTNYVIWADVISSGGSEDDESANYGLQDTIGESLIWSATNTSATYGIKAGFRELYSDRFITLSLGSATVDLGTITAATTGTGSHTITIDATVANGFSMTVSGATLSSGGNTIDAIGTTAAASTPGTEQFGLNLVDNSAPAIGADPGGTAPIGSAVDQYAIANSFAFTSGNTVASSTADINPTIFTVSYIANVGAATPAGDYETTVTYAATANF